MIQLTPMLRTVVIVLVFLSALFVLTSRIPEQVFSRSTDGVVVLDGVSSRVHSVSIEVVESFDVPLESKVSAYYRIVPDLSGTVFTPSFTITIQESWKQMVSDANILSLFVYKGSEKGWELIPTEVDKTAGVLTGKLPVSDAVWIVVGFQPS